MERWGEGRKRARKRRWKNKRRLGAPAGGQEAKNTDDRCERKRGSIQEMYRKREWSSERLEEEREGWRAIAKGKKWKGKITNTGARIPASRSRWAMHGACGDKDFTTLFFSEQHSPCHAYSFWRASPHFPPSLGSIVHSVLPPSFLKKLSSLRSSPSLQMPFFFLT